jgi:hypothetical protein
MQMAVSSITGGRVGLRLAVAIFRAMVIVGVGVTGVGAGGCDGTSSSRPVLATFGMISCRCSVWVGADGSVTALVPSDSDACLTELLDPGSGSCSMLRCPHL